MTEKEFYTLASEVETLKKQAEKIENRLWTIVISSCLTFLGMIANLLYLLASS